MYKLKTILEVVYSVGNLEKVRHFFCDYGGLTAVGHYETDSSVLDFWNLENSATGKEALIQFDNHPSGLIRLVHFEGTKQQYIRSSQKPWDTGGIMDINLRVPEVPKTFDELRELGFHGLSDPLFQTMGEVQLYDILMQGYDDTIIAFTHRTQPPLNLKSGFKIPSHVYNSSLTVKSLEASKCFYLEGLDFKLLTAYEVKKTKPMENMFGIPFNMIEHVNCKANIFSLDGTNDVMFQTIEFEGAEGKDFSERAIPPNRGLLLYRCNVENIYDYYDSLMKKDIVIHRPLQKIMILPYGEVECFALLSPDGVWWEFLETNFKRTSI